MSILKSEFVQVYVFRRWAVQPEYLLLKRAGNERQYPHIWQMVTGHIENDEHAVQAARREIQEETGIIDCTFFLVPYIASFYLASDDSIHSVPVFAAEILPGQEIVLSSEHQRFEWHSYDAAMKLLVFPGHKEGLRILHQGLTTVNDPHFLALVP